ncbi:MAG TPA: diguanylate cyclase [Steroidobacteraceae bacterium]|jgi:diguanylate cyclase (GGDEF)-like protein/PAS domain S-box-containing protein|nr:diguanylate cyclase [Steroidobacteraceae bacterium]
MTSFDVDIYRRLLESSPEGVVLVDAQNPEHPVVYANPGFESLTGYAAGDLVGKNLRLLQGDDRDQDARHRLRDALGKGESCRVLLRNYRKDGTVFWNEMTVLPLRDAEGRITHFAGHHRDAGERLRIDPKLSRDSLSGAHQPTAVAIRDDRLTGLFTLPYLEELLKRDWAVAQREGRSIAVFAIDIDSLDLYNATFGRAAGDSAIRRVAHCVSGCLRRSSDVTARIDGGSLMAFAPGVSNEQAMRVGQMMAERVRDLRIHHPRSAVLRYVSVSVGVSAAVPGATDEPVMLIEKSQRHLKLAKQSGRNQAA